MVVAVAGPILLGPLRDRLDRGADRLPPGRGGTPITALVLELLRRGQEVVAVTLDQRLDGPVRASGPGLRVHVGPFRPAGRARDAFRAERAAIADGLREHAPDVVHAHWTYEYALGALATDLPTLVTVRDWGPTVLAHQRDPYRAVRLGMQAWCLLRAEHLTTTSPVMQQRLRRWLRRDVPVIPNAVDDAWVDPSPVPPSRREPIVLAVCNGFARLKNTATLLRAWPAIRRARPELRLRLVGDGHGPGQGAERFAHAHGLAEGVAFVGRVPLDRVAEEQSAARLVVHPAREESFGLAVAEAMARGTPVVGGARSGAVPWVLDGGRAGLLCDVTSAEALAEAVVALDDARLDALAAAGHDRAREHFVVSRVVDRYLEQYERIAPGSTRPAVAGR